MIRYVQQLYYCCFYVRDEGEIVSGDESEDDDDDEHDEGTGMTDVIKEEFKKRKVVFTQFFIVIFGFIL